MALFRSSDIYDPFRQMERRLNNLFTDFLSDVDVIRTDNPSDAQSSHRSLMMWTPAVDVYDRPTEYILHCELPGVRKENVNVEVQEHSVMISGEQKEDKDYTRENLRVRERRFGQFKRIIPLLKSVKNHDVTAKFENGVLEVRMPKREKEQEVKKITVQ